VVAITQDREISRAEWLALQNGTAKQPSFTSAKQPSSTFEDFQTAIAQEYLSGSAIDPALYRVAVKFLDADGVDGAGNPEDQIAEALNWGRKQAGFSRREALHGAAFVSEDGTIWQIKLSRSLDSKGFGKGVKKATKYAPTGNGSRAFLPDIPVEIRRKIGKRYKVEVPEVGSFWDWLETHPEIQIILTEGGKKAGSLLSQGYVAIAIYGVNAGYSIQDKNGLPHSPKLIPDLLRFCTGGRQVTIVFDQDEAPKTRRKVSAAINKFGGLLEAQGCKVSVAVWEQSEGKGIDDAIVNAGENADEWLTATIDCAPSFEQWRKQERKARLMRLALALNRNNIQPERVTTDRYIPKLPPLRPGVIHGVQSSGTGDGKTSSIGGWVEANKAVGGFTLVLYHANSVGKQSAAAWDLPHRHDFHDNQNDLFLAAAKDSGGCVLCFDSLHRLSPDILERCNLVILDECNQGVAHLCEGGTLKERQADILAIAANLLRNVIGRGGAIVLSEVQIYQRTIEAVKTLAECDKLRFFNHKRSGFEPWDIDLRIGNPAGTSSFFGEAIEALQEDKRLIFAVASQEQGEKLERLVQRLAPEKRIVRVDSKTNDRGQFDDFWSDPNLWLRTNGIPDLLIYSPSGRSGVSITEPGFDEVWGHFSTLHPDVWMQLVGRYRLPVPRKVYLLPLIQSFGDERLCSVRGVRRRLAANQHGFARMGDGVDLSARLVAAQEAGEDCDRLLAIESATADFLAAERAAVGAQKAIAKDYFAHLMQAQGHSITESEGGKNDEIAMHLAEIKEELWREKAAIGAALQEGDEAKNIPTWHKELLAFKLRAREEFPGIDFDDPEDFYQGLVKDYGRVRRGVLLQAAAENHGAALALELPQIKAILSRKIALPHTLPRGAMRAKLIELCGVLALLDGTTYGNSDDRAIAIKAAALHWAAEIQYWLGLHVSVDQSPVDICNRLITRLGLKGKAIARPGGKKQGNRDRLYAVAGLDDPFRDRLLAAARQRLGEVQEPVEAPQPKVDSGGGGDLTAAGGVVLETVGLEIGGLPKNNKEQGREAIAA
jgi:hypothetical protein